MIPFIMTFGLGGGGFFVYSTIENMTTNVPTRNIKFGRKSNNIQDPTAAPIIAVL